MNSLSRPRATRHLSFTTLEDRSVPSGVPTSWDVRGSGGGGSLFSPQINPTNPNEYYISSDMSQLFHSTNAGTSWQTVDFRELQGNHQSRVYFTENPNVRYALDYSVVGGLDLIRPSKSTDAGTSWTPFANDPTSGGAFYFYVDPANSQRLLISDYTTLYYSGDGGATWAAKYTNSNGGNGLLVAGAFWDGSNIYVGTNNGLLVSNNNGSSFALANLNGVPTGQSIISFAGGKQGGTTRFVAVTYNTGDVYASLPGYDNGGGGKVITLDLGASSWTERNLGTGVWPFYADMANGDINTLYVAGGSSSSTPTVYKSSNGGSSWNSVLNTSNNANVQTGWSGHNGDRGWWYGELALGFVVNDADPNQLIITDYGFAHASTDGGTTWKNLNVSPSDLNPAGVSTPTGKSYHDSGLDNTTSWQVAWADASNLFIANSDVRGQRSTDGGATFGFNYSGHTRNSMYRVAVAPNGNLYGATASVHDLYQSTYLTDSRIDGGNGAVLLSTDKGATWTTIKDIGKVVSWVALDPTNANRLYASVVHSTQGGIYVTNNLAAGSASTWTKLTNPPRTEGHPFNIVVLNDGTIVASYSGRRNSAGTFTASSGIFVSTDGGATWLDRSHSGMQYWTKDIVVDPHDSTQNTWYVGVFSGWGGAPNGLGGLYKTTNRGQTWTRILNLDRVTSATFNPSDANELFVTTETDGLWYSNNIRSGSPTFTSVSSYKFRQPERVFFNPTNANEIWVTSFGGGVSVGTTGNTAPGSLQFASGTGSANENAGTVTVTVQRTGGSSGVVSVNYATSNGSAVAGSDYTSTSGTLTWADGDSAPKTITVPILEDGNVENTETFAIALTSPTGSATLGSLASTTITITDNDTPPPQPGAFRFSSSTGTINENAGTITISVQRIGGSDGSVSVNYATSDGTATNGNDYTPTNGTLSWAAGDSAPKTFTVPITDDTSIENIETFSIALASPTGGATLDTPATTTITINDNDTPPPAPGSFRLSSATGTVGENGGSITITVQRTGGSYGAVSVNYVTSNGTAASGSDYTTTTGTLTWSNGDSASKTFSVPILDDTSVEGSETFQVLLASPTNGATLGNPATATITITDNDNPPPATGQPFAVATDAGVVTTVKLYNPNGTLRKSVKPFGNSYRGGARIATGDVTGDGVADVVIGSNSGGLRATVKILNGATGNLLNNTLIPSPWSYSVASVAVGDLTGDGLADIAIALDESAAKVYVCRGGTLAPHQNFVALPGPNFWGRQQIAIGDVNADGRADVVVSGQYPDGTRVATFNGLTLGNTPQRLYADYKITGSGFAGAAHLAVGDVNGDGFADIGFGSAQYNTTARVLVLNGKTLVQTGSVQTLLDFAPAGSWYTNGVRLALRDLDGDGRADVLLGAGVGRGTRLRAYSAPSLLSNSPSVLLDFDAFPGMTNGLWVG